MRSASTPQTHGAPMPRAMTAACDVLPPCEVRMPSAAIMPARSSGFVSQRTSTHLRPASATATASAAENTASPTAAPGEAFRRLPCSMVNSMSHMSRKWFSRVTNTSSSSRPASSRPSTSLSSAIGEVLRMPATTSSPWAFTR